MIGAPPSRPPSLVASASAPTPFRLLAPATSGTVPQALRGYRRNPRQCCRGRPEEVTSHEDRVLGLAQLLPLD